jgi:hypothetical protein
VPFDKRPKDTGGIARTPSRREKAGASPSRFPNAILDLPHNFEDFLNRVGYKTRRNIRHYLKVSEAQHWVFKEKLDWGRFWEDASYLARASDYGLPRHRVIAHFNKLAFIPGAFCAGLYEGDRPLSVIAGWIYGKTAMILFQLNAKHLTVISLSMTLRSHLIRHFISQGMAQIIFIMGCKKPLIESCANDPYLDWCISRPHWLWDRVEKINVHFLQAVAAIGR